MKTTTLLLVMICLGIKFTGLNQGLGEINGYIYDKETNQPLYGATAKIDYAGNVIGDASDLNGKFSIKPLQAGTYLLEISFIGKATIKTSVLVKSGQIALRDTLFLSDDATKITTCTIYGTPIINPYEVSKPTLSSEELKGMALLRNPARLIATLSCVITNGGGEDNEIYFKGSRSNGIITYLDGMKITGQIPSVPATAIKSYSVYTGGLPAKYGDTSGGVIEIETKNFFDLYNQKIAEIGITYE